MHQPENAARRRPVSPSLAALLSFLWPGLGQSYAHRRRAALLFALPALALVAVVLVQCQVWRGPAFVIAKLLDPQVVAVIFVALVLFGLWRVIAVTHAFRSGDPRLRKHLPERVAVAVLLVAIVASHGMGAAYLLSAYQMDMSIFAVGGEDGAEVAQEPVTGSRMTVLLAGLDQFSTRSERLYDSLMVVSIDTETKRIAMVSIPRDTSGYPLYWGGKGTIKINSIPTYVRNGWLKSPDQPVTTLIKEVGYLVGVPINYYGVMDLGSFMKIIDLVGGVDITSTAVNDPTYDWLDGSPYGFQISAGAHHLDGRHALAYARSRHGAGNSDYARASRQQQILTAVARKMATPAMLLKLPSLMNQAASLVDTNFPASKVADVVEFTQSVPSANYDNYVLGPPYSVSTATSTASTSCLQLDKVAPLSIQLFGENSRYFGKTQAATC